MKNLSLNQKMSFVLGIFVAACIGISVCGIVSNGKMNNAVETVLDRNLKVRNALELRGMLRLMIIQEKNAINAESAAERAEAVKKIAELKSEQEELVVKWRGYASEFAKPKLVQIADLLAAWHDSDTNVIQLLQKGQSNEAGVLSYRKGRELRLALEAILDQLVEYNVKGMEEAKASALATSDRAKNTLIWVSVLSILLGLTLGASTLRGLIKAIDQIIASLTNSSLQLTSSAQQVASASEELSQSVSEQASSLQETAASIQEMSSMVTKNSENAQRTASSSADSQQDAAKGKEAVAEMLRAIENISASNAAIMDQTNRSNAQFTEIVNVIGEIGNKTKVINDIVFQTKLLSFNASVEAARAGEHGKGFAVVAEEVGNLAQMSGNAAKDISSMLASSIEKVGAIVSENKTKIESLVAEGKERIVVGAKIAEKCGTILDEIVGGATSVSQMAGEISTASREQSQGVQEITKAMSQLDQVTQQNSAASEQAASAAEELSTQATLLQAIVKDLVAAIKGSTSTASAASTQVPSTAKRDEIAQVRVPASDDERFLKSA